MAYGVRAATGYIDADIVAFAVNLDQGVSLSSARAVICQPRESFWRIVSLQTAVKQAAEMATIVGALSDCSKWHEGNDFTTCEDVFPYQKIADTFQPSSFHITGHILLQDLATAALIVIRCTFRTYSKA